MNVEAQEDWYMMLYLVGLLMFSFKVEMSSKLKPTNSQWKSEKHADCELLNGS